MLERYGYLPVVLWVIVTSGLHVSIAEYASFEVVAGGALAITLAPLSGLVIRRGFVRRRPATWLLGIAAGIVAARAGTMAGMDAFVALWLLLGLCVGWLPAPPPEEAAN